jgi:hypothetical protein
LVLDEEESGQKAVHGKMPGFSPLPNVLRVETLMAKRKGSALVKDS